MRVKLAAVAMVVLMVAALFACGTTPPPPPVPSPSPSPSVEPKPSFSDTPATLGAPCPQVGLRSHTAAGQPVVCADPGPVWTAVGG